MKLAYFSPLSPQKSGISDYSEELLPYLAEQAEIDLFVDGFKPTNRAVAERFRIFDYASDPAALRRLPDYDALIYHIGNDHRYHAGIYDVAREHPGIVVLHDFALQDFFLGLARTRGDFTIYLDQMEASHGARAREEAARDMERGGLPAHVSAPLLFPLNRSVARAAEAVVVHSELSRTHLLSIAPGVPVKRINHHITALAAEQAAASARHTNGDEARKSGDHALRISSFGLITPDKGIERALRALASLAGEHAFHYTLVGETNSFFDVRELIRRYGLGERVTITGHVSLAEFERRISETDIAINLRERTVGETSGSLCRIMAAGVAAIVSGVGWFAELPADSVVKIDMDESADALLHAYLKRLMEDASLRARIGENARRYTLAAHRIEQSAADYLAFIREVVTGRTRRRFVAHVSTEISRLGIDPNTDDSLLRRLSAEIEALAPARLFNAAAASSPDGQATKALTGGATETLEASAVAETAAGTGTKRAEQFETKQAETKQPAHVSSEAQRPAASLNGRLRKVEGIDYRRAAIEYPRKLDAERHHYLFTKPFYNLANKPPKHAGDGMDVETHRHFCDFANVAVALALPAGRTILDVGCGSGWLSEYFARLGYDVTGIDISPDIINIATQRVERVSYDVDHETRLRCRFLTHDIERAPLDETFDAVVCYDSLHHFEDEHAVVRHLASMVEYGGLLFILEGDKPDEGSATEEELIGVMREYETLESPFSREYLHALLSEHGFAVVGDFVSVNGLFERDLIEGERLRVEPPEVNYLLCKKVAQAGERTATRVPDSRQPGRLAARLTLREAWPESCAPQASIKRTLVVENTGDTIWLTGRAERRGSVMLALRLFDEAGNLVREQHGAPPLPRTLAPRESVELSLDFRAPETRGRYTLKIDFVAQHVCWFEQQGSPPLVLPVEIK